MAPFSRRFFAILVTCLSRWCSVTIVDESIVLESTCALEMACITLKRQDNSFGPADDILCVTLRCFAAKSPIRDHLVLITGCVLKKPALFHS